MECFLEYLTTIISNVTKEFKEKLLELQIYTEGDFIIICLNKNHDLNFVTYSRPLYDVHKIH
jgi:hypothetical protein